MWATQCLYLCRCFLSKNRYRDLFRGKNTQISIGNAQRQFQLVVLNRLEHVKSERNITRFTRREIRHIKASRFEQDTVTSEILNIGLRLIAGPRAHVFDVQIERGAFTALKLAILIAISIITELKVISKDRTRQTHDRG